MGIVSRTLKFKDEHLSHYWVRVLCFAFSIVFLALWVAGDVDADTPAYDEQEYQPDSGVTGSHHEKAVFCRQMNGTLWVFDVWAQPGDGSTRILYGYFSIDNGTTWDRIVVTQDTDPGYEVSGYPAKLFEVHALSNNSIIIGLYDFNYWGFNSKTEITFLCHWNNSDLSQWDRFDGYSSATISAINAGSGLNASDKIMYAFRKSTDVHYQIWTFDPATRSIDFVNQISNKFPDSPRVSPKGWLFWNYTREWNLLLADEPGTGVLLYCYDPFEIASPVWTATVGGTQSWMSDLVLTANGTYCWSYGWGNDRYYYFPYIKFRTKLGDLSTIRTSESSYYGMGQLGLSNQDIDWVTQICFNYDTDKFYWWGAKTYRNQETWQDMEVELFAEDYDMPYNWYGDSVTYMPYQLYPWDVGGNSNWTQIPAGLGRYWVFMEYDSGDSDYDSWVELDGTWPGIEDWTYFVPEEPEPDPNGDSLGIGEICSSNWLILLVMLVMLIAIVGMAAQL